MRNLQDICIHLQYIATSHMLDKDCEDKEAMDIH